MSDVSALSHEYQTSAKLAEELNEAILILKKARLHRRSGLNQEQRHRLANTLGAVRSRLANEGKAPGEVVPQEVVERLVGKHGSKDGVLLLEDLTAATESLSGQARPRSKMRSSLFSMSSATWRTKPLPRCFGACAGGRWDTSSSHCCTISPRRVSWFLEEEARADDQCLRKPKRRENGFIKSRHGRRSCVDAVLGDPDVSRPDFAKNFYHTYKRLSELAQAIDEGPLFALSRFRAEDRFLTHVVGEACREFRYPEEPPICAAMVSQYYCAMMEMNLILVPHGEAKHICWVRGGPVHTSWRISWCQETNRPSSSR